MGSVTKDPAAVLKYGWDWSKWLDEGDYIELSTWTVTKGDVVVNSHTVTDTLTVVKLSGGTAATSASKVTNRITTGAGLVDERTLTINVRDR